MKRRKGVGVTSRQQQGFTIIELTIAMVFVAFILIFMALTIVQMLRTYDKGVSMKQVNQAGRSIVDDISRSVKSQLPSNVVISNVDQGVLCIDKTMYIWNPLYVGNSLDTATIVTGGAAVHNAVVGNPTSGGMMARKTLVNPAPTNGCTRTSPTVAGQDSVLLGSRARVLWAGVEQGTDNRLVKLNFVIGTYSRTEFVPASPTKYVTPQLQSPQNTFACLPSADGSYCSFAEFSTVIYLSRE